MNREQIRHGIELLQAIEAGTTVHERSEGCEWHDFDPKGENSVILLGGSWEYRVKPEPREVWLTETEVEMLMNTPVDTVGTEHVRFFEVIDE